MLTKSPDRWPTLWRDGVTGTEIATALKESLDCQKESLDRQMVAPSPRIRSSIISKPTGAPNRSWTRSKATGAKVERAQRFRDDHIAGKHDDRPLLGEQVKGCPACKETWLVTRHANGHHNGRRIAGCAACRRTNVDRALANAASRGDVSINESRRHSSGRPGTPRHTNSHPAPTAWPRTAAIRPCDAGDASGYGSGDEFAPAPHGPRGDELKQPPPPAGRIPPPCFLEPASKWPRLTASWLVCPSPRPPRWPVVSLSPPPRCWLANRSPWDEAEGMWRELVEADN